MRLFKQKMHFMRFPNKILALIPPAGKETHKEFAEERICNTPADAEKLFKKATERLQQPHGWKDLTGPLGAEFQPFSAGGNALERVVKVGDLLKIKVGGPLPLGNDWVVISQLVSDREKDVEAVALQVHPCGPPANQSEAGTEDKTEHFFDECATSTWIVCWQGKIVSAHYRGRQEVPNEESKGLLRTVRDKVVAAAAIIGLADLQWKALLKGFLEE